MHSLLHNFCVLNEVSYRRSHVRNLQVLIILILFSPGFVREGGRVRRPVQIHSAYDAQGTPQNHRDPLRHRGRRHRQEGRGHGRPGKLVMIHLTSPPRQDLCSSLNWLRA